MLTSPQNSPATDSPEAIEGAAARLREVRQRIASAALRCGRSPESVTLVAVSKQHSAYAVRAMANAGQHDFGESYLQEALEKVATLQALGLTWHYIGQVQSNKTRPIAEHFDWVHTVDRLKIAQRLNEQRPEHLAPLNVCIQVKLEEEPGKGGVAPEDVAGLAREIIALPRLRLRGLMCIPPPRSTHAEQLVDFNRCAELRVQLNRQGLALDTLSMGMSGDLEAAVEAGATLIRVGTALFGERINA